MDTRFLFNAGSHDTPEVEEAVRFDADQLVHHIVICGALFINHIYIDIFLTVTKYDSMVLNSITWALFIIGGIKNNHISLNTTLSLLMLGGFALKFSWDGQIIKD